MIGKEEGTLDRVERPAVTKAPTTHTKVFFISGPLHSDWLPSYLVARDELGVTIRSESGDRRTFYPWHIVESIETERRES